MTHPRPIDTQEYRDRCIALRAGQVGPPAPISPADESELAFHEHRLSDHDTPWGIHLNFGTVPHPRPRGQWLRWFLLGLVGKSWEKQEEERVKRGVRLSIERLRRWYEACEQAALARQAEYDLLVAMMDGHERAGP